MNFTGDRCFIPCLNHGGGKINYGENFWTWNFEKNRKKLAKKNLVSLFEVLKSNSFMERQMLRREVANPAVI